jgi:multicomponent Na+:H+ antiporter subunit F
MNLWLLASGGICLGLVPCAFLCLKGGAERRLVGLEMTSLLVTLAMMGLTVWSGRLPFIDIALTMAIMSFGGGLVFVRFLEKHL